MGKRPAGTGLGREADELSDEEEALMQDKVGLVYPPNTSVKLSSRTKPTCLAIASSCPLGGGRHKWRWTMRL